MNNVKKIFQIISKLKFILSRKQIVESFGVLVVLVLSSFLELLGVSAIMPFVEAVTNPSALMESKFIVILGKYLCISNSRDLLEVMGVALILIYIVKNVFMLVAYYIQYDYSSRIGMDLSIKMLSSYMKRPYVFFLDINSADVMRGCSNDTEGVYVILYNLMQVFSEVITLCLITIYLFYTDALIAFSVVMLVFIVMMGLLSTFKPIFKRIGTKYLTAYTEKTKTIYQVTNGIKDLYVTQRKELFEDAYRKVSDETRLISRKREVLNSFPDRITEGICVSGIIGIVVIRLMINDDGMIEFIPKLAAFAMAAFKMFPSVGKITSRMNMIIYQIPALDNVYNNFVEAEKYESSLVSEEKNTIVNSADISFEKEIKVAGVKWKYKDASNETLSNVNIEIKKGESIGLIGPSGSGKTTLADIILGLLYPQEGTVTVDGVDIFSIPKQWAKLVGYVPQSVFLIDDTVRNNVLFGLQDKDDSAVWRALEQAQLKPFIESLPDGLDTIVGERGVKFSGGQRQRIAIARALYYQPQILVLDEATAALDNETENAVMEAVESLQGKITMIIVAHRLTTIRKCNKVYEIKNGVATLVENRNI